MAYENPRPSSPSTKESCGSHNILQDDVIKALLFLAPVPSSREARNILSSARNAPLSITYDRILQSSKLSSKELHHFLTIIYRSAAAGLNLQLLLSDLSVAALVTLKFPTQDKYTMRALIAYFDIVDRLYERFTTEQRLELCHRYLFLFQEKMFRDTRLYDHFTRFLRDDFLEYFLFKRFYLTFPFLKEFVVDFRIIGQKLAKIAYECPSMRELVFQVLLSDNINVDWLNQNWHIPPRYSISKVFYRFDCTPFAKNIAEDRFSVIGDVLEYIRGDIHGVSPDTCAICLYGDRIGLSYDFTDYRSDSHQKQHSGNSTGEHDAASAIIFDSLPSTNSSIEPMSVLSKQNPLETFYRDGYSANSSSQKQELQASIRKCERLLSIKRNQANFMAEFNRTKKLPPGIDMRFVRLSQTIDLKTIGEFLCSGKNLKRLEEFTKTFHFTAIDLLEALRTYFATFALVGESQVIERVVQTFTTEYLTQNYPDATPSTSEMYVSLVYSLIVLNTMLHNPSVDKKPGIDEYLGMVKHVNSSIIRREALILYYEDIKTNEIKMATTWTDTYDLFRIYTEIINENYSLPIPADFHLCDSCILAAYHILFRETYKTYEFLEPSTFFQICRLLEHEPLYETYMRANKDMLSKGLPAYCSYIEHLPVRNLDILREFIEMLKRAERPKSFVFSDFKSLFSTSKADVNSSTLHDQIRASSVPSLAAAVVATANLKFADRSVCAINYPQLVKLLMEEDTPLLNDITLQLTLTNSEFLDNISFLSQFLINQTVLQKPEMLSAVTDSQKLSFLSKKSNFTDFERSIFSLMEVYDQQAFEVACKMYNDPFSESINVKRNSELGELAINKLAKELADHPADLIEENGQAYLNGSFEFCEKYPEPLKEQSNVAALCKPSIRKIKQLAGSRCPFDSELLEHFDCLAYLIHKAEPGNEAIEIECLKIMKLFIADPMFVALLCAYVYPLLKTSSSEIYKIFQVILRNGRKGKGPVCCGGKCGVRDKTDLISRMASLLLPDEQPHEIESVSIMEL